jgi:hypothetical protein
MLFNWFPVSSGTRQGASLLPFLFSLLLSPLVDELHAHNTGIDFFGEKIGCLMFADDIVLVADSAWSLQAMLDVCTLFFSRWQFTVSADKTRIVSLGHCETLKIERSILANWWYLHKRFFILHLPDETGPIMTHGTTDS